MVCNRLCKQFEFGSKSYVKGSKQCLMCDLFIITESISCACCGNALSCRNSEIRPKSFIY